MGLPKIKSATDLRNDLFNTLQEVLKGHIQVITHKDGDSVLISKEDYDALLDRIETLQGISRGMKDLAEERTYSHKQALKELHKHISKK